MSSVFQLFEELQEWVTRKAEDQRPSQAPGLRRRAGSGAQGEGLWGTAFPRGSIGGGHLAQYLLTLLSSECCKQEVGCRQKDMGSTFSM